MNSTICWKLFSPATFTEYVKVAGNLLITIYIRPFIKNMAIKVKILINYNNNQQKTKNKFIFNKFYWVGFSETICGIFNYNNNNMIINNNTNINTNINININMSGTFSDIESEKVPINNINNNHFNISSIENKDKFNEWLAGLIDGDGYFGITSKKYPNCEITLDLKDEKTLRQIQNKFGGSIKLRNGINAIRYRLHNKEGIIKLINAVNGNIRNSKRLVQFNQVCNLLNIKVIPPIDLNIDNAWFIGFFDADGTITYSLKNNNPQLTISVTNKYYIDVKYFKDVLGGNIYFDKAQNGYFKWSIQSKKDILYFKDNYIKNNPSRTKKINRLLLINTYYKLKDIKAYKEDINSCLYKAWLKFNEKWNN